MRHAPSHRRPSSRTSAIAAALITFAVTSSAIADVLLLTDGTRLVGQARREGTDWVVVDPAGKTTRVDAGRVSSFDLQGRAASPDVAARALESLRASTAHLSDLNQIVGRYRLFIAAHPRTPAAASAGQDLKAWQDRLAQGDVKVGPNWVTPADAERIFAQEAALAQQVRSQLDQGRTRESIVVLQQALAENDADPTAHYLMGLALAMQGQNVPAKNEFGKVLAQMPDHAASLNNLAVVLWRLHQPAGAAAKYALAMLADPGNRDILDNVAEALHGMPAESADAAPVGEAQRLFLAQDAQLRRRLAGRDQYRWGSTWVSSAQLQNLTAAEQIMNDQLASLQSEYDQTRSSIATEDTQIAQTQQIMAVYEAQAEAQTRGVRGNTTGGGGIMPIHAVEYANLQQQLANLQSSRSGDVEHLNQLQQQATRTRQSLAVQRYSGEQKLIGPAEAPLLGGTALAAQQVPTTQP